MKNGKKRLSNSKLLSCVILGITTLLTSFAISKELEGVATAVWSTGIPSAVGLYINKQFQDRKWGEIMNTDNTTNNGANQYRKT